MITLPYSTKTHCPTLGVRVATQPLVLWWRLNIPIIKYRFELVGRFPALLTRDVRRTVLVLVLVYPSERENLICNRAESAATFAAVNVPLSHTNSSK